MQLVMTWALCLRPAVLISRTGRSGPAEATLAQGATKRVVVPLLMPRPLLACRSAAHGGFLATAFLPSLPAAQSDMHLGIPTRSHGSPSPPRFSGRECHGQAREFHGM